MSYSTIFYCPLFARLPKQNLNNFIIFNWFFIFFHPLHYSISILFYSYYTYQLISIGLTKYCFLLCSHFNFASHFGYLRNGNLNQWRTFNLFLGRGVKISIYIYMVVGVSAPTTLIYMLISDINAYN